MVHALQEVHGVLKPSGTLVDLRPTANHWNAGITRNGRHRELGALHEQFDDDHAASRAAAHVLRKVLFNAEWHTQFGCKRVMPTFDDFRTWFDEFVKLADLPPHDGLIQKVERALKAKRGKSRIVVRGTAGNQDAKKIGRLSLGGQGWKKEPVRNMRIRRHDARPLCANHF